VFLKYLTNLSVSDMCFFVIFTVNYIIIWE